MQRPPLSFWQIWNMSFGFFGIQFGWGLQMANMSAIYQYLHASESDLPILWLAAPLTGLLVQPIIGYASDRTWGPLGRRRPYFLVGAILASLALLAMPRSSTVWMAAGLLWVLDASVNITMEPFRAFVGDLLPAEQRKTGFAMQSLLIGLGAVLSSALPFILINGFGVGHETTLASPIPPAVRLAFYIGSGIFFASVLYTILTTREYPPEDVAGFERMKRDTAGLGHAFREIFGGIGSMPGAMRQLAVVQFFTWFALFCMWLYFVPAVAKGVFHGTPLGVQEPALLTKLRSPDGEPSLARGARIARAYEARKTELAAETTHSDSPQPWYDPMLQMLGLKPASPDASERIDEETLKNLMARNLVGVDEATKAEAQNPLVQCFASALYTHQVTQPDSKELGVAASDVHRDLARARLYQEGAAWGGVCFSAYNGTAFVFAFALLALVRNFSARTIHRICLFCGGAGLLMAVALHEPKTLIVSMVLVGVAWASILSMPYAMLANAIPASKMGFYMGVFNFFIVIPQILASLGLGALMKSVLGDNAMNAVILGGGSMLLAGLCVGLVPKNVDAESQGSAETNRSPQHQASAVAKQC
jgi:maltose/moltooligosaccharide transporter